jgi:flagellar hook-associated protein 3 FlgL
MSSYALGDLAQNFMLQRRGVSLRNEMAKLSEELTTGRVTDVRKITGGNFSFLNSIERELKTLEGYRIVGTEAGQFADATQLQLERVQTASGELGAALLSFAKLPSGPQLLQGANEARSKLETMFASLNADLAGRSLFSGTATDTNALTSPDVLLAALETAVAGAATPNDIRAAAEAWFDSPAGFSATIYQGATDDLAPFQVTEFEDVTVGVRADNEALRNILLQTSLVAISDSTTLGYSIETQADLQGSAGEWLIANQQEITAVRGAVGLAQERIETLTVRNAAQRTSLEYTRNDFLAVDPFESATKLEDVQFRLESLYTITARMSDLSLVNFLR